MKIWLVLADPIDKNLGIQGEYSQICLSDQLRIREGGTLADHTLLQSIINVFLLVGNGAHSVPLFGQGPGIAAAHQTQPDDQNIGFFGNDHASLTSMCSCFSCWKKSG